MAGHRIVDVDLDDEVVIVNGERLTECAAEQLSDELAGRARSNANLVPGRKSLSGRGKHSPVLNVRVSDATLGMLRVLAGQRGVSVSKLSRQAIDEFVERSAGG